MKDRFHGIGRLYGVAALPALAQSRVMVVGIGARSLLHLHTKDRPYFHYFLISGNKVKNLLDRY